MTEDNLILLFAFMICWLTIVGLTINNKHKKQTLVISLAIQIPYTIFFFYGLAFKSQYGSGLVWWFFLLMVIGLHGAINLIITIINLIRHKKVSKTIDG